MTEASSTAWLHQVRAGADLAAPQLLFLPAAGGSASAGWPVAEAVPSDWSVWALQYPGRGPRLADPLPDSITELALGCLPELLAEAERTVLFGHSFGAFVAYELAQQLQRHGSHAAGLIVSGTPSPGTPLRPMLVEELSDRSLISLLGQQSGTAPALLANEEMMLMVLPALRSDLSLARTYLDQHRDTLQVPVVALGGQDDALVSAEALAGWQHLTDSWLGWHIGPGGHFFYLENPGLLRAVLILHWCDEERHEPAQH